MTRHPSPITRTLGRAALLAVGCALAPAALAQAATIQVTTQLDLVSSSDGQCSLREAIGAQALDSPSGSVAGECPAGDPGHDTIAVPPGLYPLNSMLGFYGHVTIAGAGPAQTIISGGGGNRVIYLQYNASDQPDVTLDGVTITGGHAHDGGPGDSVFGSYGAPGGFPGQPAAGGSGGFAEQGGAIYNSAPSQVTIVNSRLTGNSAGNGGTGGTGVGGDGGPAVGAGSCGTAGTGTGGAGGGGGDGGAIYSYGPVVVRDSVISGNNAGTGGDGGLGGGGFGGGGGAQFQQGCSGGTGTGGAGGLAGSGAAIYSNAPVTIERSVIGSNHSGSGGLGGEGDGGQGPIGGSSGGTGGEGGDGTGGVGGKGGDGAVVATGAATVTVIASTFSDNGAGAGGSGGRGTGNLGGPGGGTTGIGWFGGVGQGGTGGRGGTGAAIHGGTAAVSVSASLLVHNAGGAGGRGGSASGGQGGNGGSANGHAGDGGSGTGGDGGVGGAGGISTAGPSQLTNTTVTQNEGGDGGAGGSGAGGSGGNAPAQQGGYGANGYGGTGGDAGSGAVHGGAGTLAILQATVSFNGGGSAGAGGTATGGAAGSGTTGNPQPGTGMPGAAGAAGGGGVQAGGATVSLANSVVAQNAPSNCAGSIGDGLHDIVFGDTTCPGTTADPKLAALADNGGPTSTQALGAGSAAREAVPAAGAGCALTDERGVSRPRFGDCDAGAFEQSPPDVTTGAATGVSSSSATLTGSVAPNAGSAGYRFVYGTTGEYGSTTDARDLAGGVTPAGVSVDIGGLAAATTYHYRLLATTPDGTQSGADQTVTTGAVTGGSGGPSAANGDKTPPIVKLALTRQKLRKALKKGYFAFFFDNERGNAVADLFASGKTAKGAATKRKRVAHGTLKVTKAGKQKLIVKFTKKAKKAFARRKKVVLTLVLTVKDAAGNATKKTAKVTLKR